MQRIKLGLLGTVLLSAVLGGGLALGADGPPASSQKGTSPAEKGVVKPTINISGTTAVSAAAKPVSAEEADADQLSADEQAILLTGAKYLEAYANADAQAIADQFTLDAEFIDEQGTVHQGREAIAAVMAACFAENSDSQMELDINAIRIISPNVAIEDGVTTLTRSGSAEHVSTSYTAVHVKVDGKWLVASVREQRRPDPRQQHRSQLQQLSWLNGDWVDECDDSVVLFSCDAVDNGNFLLRTFVIQIAGEEAMSGSQRIGWDPVNGKLRAWTFDSEGGYADGFWHGEGDRWVLKSTGVTADGETASSTCIYTFVDEHTITKQSVDQEIAGVAQPDSELVTIVRRAPTPAIDDHVNAANSK